MTRIKDEYYMRRALSLAIRGTGMVSPNPLVGCVLVKDDEIVGEGYHRKYGDPHAEVMALRAAGERARGATAYVTLEPCSHFGKTPPCAPALVKAGIVRSVVSMVDPDSRVCGRGLNILKEAGIEVSTGIMEEEARWMNRSFIKGAISSMPWITVKVAVGVDGKIALPDGESKWITGETSRTKAHLLRAEYDAIMVGSGTVNKDKPSLTVRHVEGRSPVKVIVGNSCDCFDDSGCIIYTSENIDSCERGLNMVSVLEDLHKRGIRSVLVEGGASIVSSLLSDKLVDEMSLFVAPKVMGEGISFSRGFSCPSMVSVPDLKILTVRREGVDLWMEGVFPCSLDLLRPQV